MNQTRKSRPGGATRSEIIIQEIVENRGITPGELASKTGVSNTYAYFLTHGHRVPSAKWLHTFSQAFDLDERDQLRLHRAAAVDHGFLVNGGFPEPRARKRTGRHAPSADHKAAAREIRRRISSGVEQW